MKGGNAVIIDRNDPVYDNRELSWLKFNRRVLEEAFDKNVPLMERLKFAAIFSGNLDEFFMVRTGSLINASLTDDGRRDGKTKLRPSEQLSFIYTRVNELCEIKDSAVAEVETRLSAEGIKRLEAEDMTAAQAEYAEKYYSEKIAPLLECRVIYENDPQPFSDGGKIYAAVHLDPEKGGRVGAVSAVGKIGSILPLPSENAGFEYILTDELILHNAERLFPDRNVSEKTLVSVTRSAYADIDGQLCGADDYLDTVSRIVEERKGNPAVRLRLSERVSDAFLNMLAELLGLPRERVFFERTPLNMSYVFSLYDKISDRGGLFYGRLSPRRSPSVAPDVPMFEQIEKRDILLSYPYESIMPFIRLLEESAEDEYVVSVKMTLYRVAADSKIVAALCKAAENGKSVTVWVELRARFDEENNIRWARVLERAGCRVMFGPPYYKVHSKLCLIEREKDGVLSRVTQIGTGNYNEKTAELYADLSLMTANPEIAADAEAVFAALLSGKFAEDTAQLLVSPLCLRNRFMEMADREIAIVRAGGEGYIGAKMNSLTDKAIIDKLIECSRAGVKIDLIVRGSCCLIAGVNGMTENIRVISIVGRFLEHSRIYIFGSEERSRVYISSADLMTRNTCRRVEVAAPLLDENIKKIAVDYFKAQMNDNVKARVQQPNGVYKRSAGGGERLDSQEEFYRRAYKLEPPSPETEESKEPIREKKGLLARLISFFRRKRR